MRIFLAVVVWTAAIAAAIGLSSAVAGSIHNTSTASSSSAAGSPSAPGSTVTAATPSAPSLDPSSVKATSQISLFQGGNLSRLLSVAKQRFGANAQVDNFVLYPGYLSVTVVRGGSEFDFYANVAGTSTTTSAGPASGAASLIKLSDVKADVPAILAARIAGAGRVPEARLHYMVARADPLSGHFEWLIYPVSGSGAEYFQTSGVHAPLFEYTGSALVRLPG